MFGRWLETRLYACARNVFLEWRLSNFSKKDSLFMVAHSWRWIIKLSGLSSNQLEFHILEPLKPFTWKRDKIQLKNIIKRQLMLNIFAPKFAQISYQISKTMLSKAVKAIENTFGYYGLDECSCLLIGPGWTWQSDWPHVRTYICCWGAREKRSKFHA